MSRRHQSNFDWIGCIAMALSSQYLPESVFVLFCYAYVCFNGSCTGSPSLWHFCASVASTGFKYELQSLISSV